jgi:hypothetical protein
MKLSNFIKERKIVLEPCKIEAQINGAEILYKEDWYVDYWKKGDRLLFSLNQTGIGEWHELRCLCRIFKRNL